MRALAHNSAHARLISAFKRQLRAYLEAPYTPRVPIIVIVIVRRARVRGTSEIEGRKAKSGGRGSKIRPFQ